MMNKHIRTLSLLVSFLCFLTSCSKSFSFLVLPDTQHYSRFYPEIFYSQTNWIRNNSDSIAFVLHAGDITSQNTDDQWTVAQKAMSALDDQVPYVLSIGNHDIGTGGKSDVRNTEIFNRYFPYDRLSKSPGFGGAYTAGQMDNTWYTFKAGGLKWLVVSLEFGPRDSVLEWAGDIIKKHRGHRVILLTHAYMYNDDSRMSSTRQHKWLAKHYGIGKNPEEETANDGEEIWEKLVSRHSNMRFVFSGHVLGDGTGKLVSEGIHGNKVYQMLANYQTGVEGSENGGNGFLRLLSVHPRKGTVAVRTFSPYTGTFKTEPDQEFTFENVKF